MGIKFSKSFWGRASSIFHTKWQQKMQSPCKDWEFSLIRNQGQCCMHRHFVMAIAMKASHIWSFSHHISNNWSHVYYWLLCTEIHFKSAIPYKAVEYVLSTVIYIILLIDLSRSENSAVIYVQISYLRAIFYLPFFNSFQLKIIDLIWLARNHLGKTINSVAI